MKNKIFFLSFYDSRLYRSKNRIKDQAKQFNFYDKIIVCNEKDLDYSFKEKYKEKLIVGSRGFGYWCWKPQIILQLYKNIKYGDIIQYSDVGCHLNHHGIERLRDYINLTNNSHNGILAFRSTNPQFPLIYDDRKLLDLVEYKWTKGDLFDYFGVRNNRSITHTQSYGATNLFIKKCEKSEEFLNKWLSVINHNFCLIDNSESISPNFDGFIEHRHDQSILSILCKLNNVPYISSYEYWYPSKKNINKPDWNSLKTFPIHRKRDKNFGFIKFFLSILSRTYKKILRVYKLK